MIDNSISFSEAFETFLLAKRAENVVKGTLHIYEETARFWTRRWGDLPLGDITADHVRQWLVWLQGNEQEGVEPPSIKSATVHIRFRNMRTFFRWCESDDLITKSPMRNVKPPIVERLIPDVLTEAEVLSLLNGVKGNGDRNAYRDYCIHLFFLVTGVRLAELAALNIDDLHLREGFVRVMGKGRIQRFVPLFDKLPLELKRYMLKHRRPANGERGLFVNERGERLDKLGVQRVVIRDLNRYVPRLNRKGPHTHRHTACTFLLRRTGDIKRVAEIMGHTTVTTTEGYTHLTPEDLIAPVMGIVLNSPIDDLLKNGKKIRNNGKAGASTLEHG